MTGGKTTVEFGVTGLDVNVKMSLIIDGFFVFLMEENPPGMWNEMDRYIFLHSFLVLIFLEYRWGEMDVDDLLLNGTS